MNAKNYKVLVADDDPAIVDAVRMTLEDEGYRVETTVDGTTEQRVRSDRPDLILLDIWMSGVDGRDICRRLKADPATGGIPVIMISANRDTETLARQCGADDFIAKPFDIDTLLDKIAACLEGEGAKGEVEPRTGLI